jgi:hypothetical protein
MQHQVREKMFFSHQRADEPFVRALAQRLQWSGFDVIPDLWDEKGAEPVPPELSAALSQVNFFFYVLSPSAVESKWTRGAHYALLFQRMKQAGLRIVPLVRGACPSPPLMAPLHHIDFRRFNPADPAAFRTDQPGPFQELMALLGRKHQKGGGELIPPGMATYEFTFQPRPSKPKNLDRSLNYELIIRNVKKDPLRNFALTVRFRQPVLEVKYDKYRSSSGELSTGEGLSPDGTRFNWIGDSLYGGGGFALFNVRSKEPPQISRISTKFVGRVAGTNRVIAPDPEGI